MASSYVLKRIAAVAVLAASAAIVQIGLSTPAQAATWVRPTTGNIVQGFNASSHKGVDIAAAYNTPIYAVHDGWVQQVVCQSSTGTCDSPGDPNGSGCGWYVGINHPDGTGTLYCHMIARPLVNVGDNVRTGQKIGYVGSSGQSSGPHLHFQTHNGQSNTNANVVDPEAYMSARGVNLRGGGGTQPPPPPPTGTYWVDTFDNATGRSTPGGAATGTLYAGRNYVYCKFWGPVVIIGGAYNHWWLKTDLDSGNPWRNQWVSAYFLSRWGNDEAKDNNGNDIPLCKFWVDTFDNATGRSTPGGNATGTLNAGRNYVYCRVWGPLVYIGGAYNHYWLKTDLDSGNPWQNQWVSAYFLSHWGNDQAKDNDGVDIPNCG